MNECAGAKNGKSMDLKSGDFTVLEVTEISCNALKGDPLWNVFELWKQWAGDRCAPTWAEVDMLALPPEIIPQSVVVDVVDGGEDFKYRFWGTGYADHYGIDETGNLLSQSIGPSFIEATFKQLQDVIVQQRPIAFEVSISTTLTHLTQKKINLRLPIEDTPGRVTKIMTASQFAAIPISDADRIRQAVFNERQKLEPGDPD